MLLLEEFDYVIEEYIYISRAKSKWTKKTSYIDILKSDISFNIYHIDYNRFWVQKELSSFVCMIIADFTKFIYILYDR
jgi:predicted nucleotidyltransferase